MNKHDRIVATASAMLFSLLLAGCDVPKAQKESGAPGSSTQLPPAEAVNKSRAPQETGGDGAAPAANSSSAPPMLGDAGGGDCAFNTRMYNRVHKRGEPREKLESSAVPFLDDLCDLDRIHLGIDGETVELRRKDEIDRGWSAGSQRVYANLDYTVELEAEELIEEYLDDSELAHCRTHAIATIRHGAQRWQVDGTLAYDLAESRCP